MNDFDFSSEFPLDENLIYLNHAAVAPWPRRTADAVKAFAGENAYSGARYYPKWMEVESKVRTQLQWLLNAPSADDIALLKNTSEALSVVAYGLDWDAGDNVVISNEEFPSNRIVWESLASKGIDVRQVDLAQGPTPEHALTSQIDRRTRLLSISSVQYASGLRMDLEALGRYCRNEGILFCVDAIQSLGAVSMDVQAINADFVMADAHKWMLGPEGIAVFYCSAELRERLRLNQFGWHMVEDYLNFDHRDWAPAHSARRFECGSPNMLGIHALSASLSVLEEVGMDDVEAQVIHNAGYLIEQIRNRDSLELLSPSATGRFAGIVTFAHKQADAKALYAALMDQGVVCAMRGGGIRFSPHFYTPESRIDQAIERVAAYKD